MDPEAFRKFTKVLIELTNHDVARKKDTGELFAMKVIDKTGLDLYTEVNIMKKLDGLPFFPKLYWTFETVFLNYEFVIDEKIVFNNGVMSRR